MMKRLPLFDDRLVLQHRLRFERGPLDLFDISQLETARTVHIILQRALTEDEIIWQTHRHFLENVEQAYGGFQVSESYEETGDRRQKTEDRRQKNIPSAGVVALAVILSPAS